MSEKGRFGEPLDRSSAEALARKWADGFIISQTERAARAKSVMEQVAMAEEAGIEGIADRYPGYAEAMQFMQEKGLTQLEVEADKALLAQEECEDQCSREVRAKCGYTTTTVAECESWYRECLSQSRCSQPPFIPDDPNNPVDDLPSNPQAPTVEISIPRPRSSRQESGESTPTPAKTEEPTG